MLETATPTPNPTPSPANTGPAPAAGSEASETRALNRVVLETLRRVTTVLIFIYAALVLEGMLGFSPNTTSARLATLVTWLVLVVVAVAIKRGKVANRYANPLAATIASLLFFHLFAVYLALRMPFFENLFVLAVAGLGFLVLSPRWLAVAIAVTTTAWAMVAFETSSGDELLNRLLAITVAVIGAAVFQWARLTTTGPLRSVLAKSERGRLDLRTAEDALLVKHQQYRSIFETMIDGLTLRSLDQHRLLEVNPAMAEMLGYSVEEVLQLEPKDYIHPDSLPTFAKMLETVARGKRYPYTAKAIHRDGSIVEIEGTFIPFGFDGERMSMGIVKDVTARNAALDRLSASEERYRALVEDQTEFVVRWTPDGTRTFVNQAYCRHLHAPRETLLGSTFFSPEEEAERLEVLVKLADWSPGNPPIASRQLFLEADGEQRWLEWFDRAIHDEGGRIVEIQSVGRDIHEQVLAQERQRASDARFRTLFEHSPDAIFVESLEGEVLDVNLAACELHGLTRDQLIGKDVVDLVPEHAKEAAMSDFRALVAGDKERIDGLSVGKEGQDVPVSLTGSRIQYSGQHALLIHARDVSEQRTVSEALRLSEQKYRRLFEQSRDAIIISAPDKAIEDANPAALELFECNSKEELRLMDPLTLYERSEDREELVRRVAEHGYVEDFELGLVSRTGKRFTVLDTITALHDASGRLLGYRSILRDVTERRRLQAQLRQAQKMEAVGRLAGGLAHDFNNMLTVIGGYADLGLRCDTAGPFAENFSQIQEATRRATDLTGQLLVFSRQQDLNPQVLDLNSVVSGFETLLRGSLTEDIYIELNLDQGLGSIEADPGQVEQVLMNLAVNAGHAMPDGGRLVIETRNVELTEVLHDEGGQMTPGPYVMLVVSDTGCGMSEETRSRVFEPFFTTKKKGQGTGLGMSTAYGIVQQSGGSIWVYSEEGQGTVFKIYLPRIDADQEQTKEPVQEAVTHHGAERATILITDDDSGIRSFLANALGQKGFRVLTATSAEEAQQVSQALDRPIDILLTDLILPGADGIQLAEAIRGRYPRAAIILMSGYSERATPNGYEIPDHAIFLGKPFAIDEVTRVVREALAGGEAEAN